jgi:type IV pilus assembly protein PilO
MALTEKDKKQLKAILIVLPLGLIVYLWLSWRPPKVEEANQLQQRIDSLQAEIDSARAILARGSVEDLNRMVEDYQSSLGLMRTLVPEGTELPNLIDDISSQARQRGVEIRELSPLPPEDAYPFQRQRYRFSVTGRYDEIGAFLTDIASMPRIMVPYGVSIRPSDQRLAEASGEEQPETLVETDFQLRTFVKTEMMDDLGEGGAGG